SSSTVTGADSDPEFRSSLPLKLPEHTGPGTALPSPSAGHRPTGPGAPPQLRRQAVVAGPSPLPGPATHCRNRLRAERPYVYGGIVPRLVDMAFVPERPSTGGS